MMQLSCRFIHLPPPRGGRHTPLLYLLFVGILVQPRPFSGRSAAHHSLSGKISAPMGGSAAGDVKLEILTERPTDGPTNR